MKFTVFTSIFISLVSSTAVFAGGGSGGCGRIPRAVEDQELRCIGQVNSGFFSVIDFDVVISYDSEIPYDQGHEEVVDYLVYDGHRSEKNLGITFHCDEYKDGEMKALGKQFIIFGSKRYPIELGSGTRAIENLPLENFDYTAEISCYLE